MKVTFVIFYALLYLEMYAYGEGRTITYLPDSIRAGLRSLLNYNGSNEVELKKEEMRKIFSGPAEVFTVIAAEGEEELYEQVMNEFT